MSWDSLLSSDCKQSHYEYQTIVWGERDHFVLGGITFLENLANIIGHRSHQNAEGIILLRVFEGWYYYEFVRIIYYVMQYHIVLRMVTLRQGIIQSVWETGNHTNKLYNFFRLDQQNKLQFLWCQRCWFFESSKHFQ